MATSDGWQDRERDLLNRLAKSLKNEGSKDADLRRALSENGRLKARLNQAGRALEG
jgi:hypothetical protein